MRGEARPILVILLAWFCFALAMGVSRVFEGATASDVALTVWILTALALLACWKIGFVRAGVNALTLPALISIHVTRFVGIYFLILGSQEKLPIGFARPAGIGDIAVATGAAVLLVIGVARVPRPVLLIWNALGLLDIIFVVSSALRFALRNWQSMAALRALPLSLLPMFFVPFIIVSHVLIFVRLGQDLRAKDTKDTTGTTF